MIKKKQEEEKKRDRIRGCLFGGAVGDALGYEVEFLGESEIFVRFGEKGIQEYQYNRWNGKALISDDTQMTLFTANGLLYGETQRHMQGSMEKSAFYVSQAYQDWLATQEFSLEEFLSSDHEGRYISWLMDVPELYSRRTPGRTCLSALRRQKHQKDLVESYIQIKLNDSKGCGGVMRVAPVALQKHSGEIKELDMEGAEIAAITHSHSLGYMPAAVLTHIIHRILFPEISQSLKEIVLEARDTAAELFAGDSHLKELTDIIELAVELSENGEDDLENIHQLGEGWVAEETLGIAIYCSLRYQQDFSGGIIAAVNHRGDSDSTGAVTGNILGALLGYEAIEERWKTDLELGNVILEIADDCYRCQLMEWAYDRDTDWNRKYVQIQGKSIQTQGKSVQLQAVRGDITKDHGVQAIVNAANTSLLGGGGVDGAIHRAAGPKLLAECRLLQGCKTGKAKLTKAYQLPCEYIIHTPGPRWNGGQSGERELLASCYCSCLDLARENGIRSLAFPSISTGIFRFPVEEAAKIAVNTVKSFTDSHPEALDLVKWVLFDEETLKIYQRELGDRGVEGEKSVP